ncbi:DUF241 domain protein [Senna tora]|uniref:DUF241 domain protein n=1 Tax=Senna tora TaxID=362788 RepID=A0A834TVL3_9FABA|nr:DUF241 domain protein [Senna tora]
MMKKATTMPTFSPKHSSSSRGVRSISLPTRSHPTTAPIEEHLNKLKSWESSSSSSKLRTICSALCGLTELYKCIEDLLKLPLTQQALSQHHHEKWVDELLDCPVRLLDVLGNTRDAISCIKAGVRDLQSAIRRRKLGDLSMEETHVCAYWSLRRKMRKESTKSLLLLKQIDASFGAASPPLDLNTHLSAVVRVLREASFMTCSIFHSLLLFLCAPILKSKPNKWAFVSKLMQKGVLVNEEDNVSELEKVDFALNSLMMNNVSQNGEKIQLANGRLEDLVEGLEELESGLECLFKYLINNRVSFLNIVSP